MFNCDRETSIMRKALGLLHHEKYACMYIHIYVGKFVWIIFLPIKCRWIFTARYVFDTDDNFTYEM